MISLTHNTAPHTYARASVKEIGAAGDEDENGDTSSKHSHLHSHDNPEDVDHIYDIGAELGLGF